MEDPPPRSFAEIINAEKGAQSQGCAPSINETRALGLSDRQICGKGERKGSFPGRSRRGGEEPSFPLPEYHRRTFDTWWQLVAPPTPRCSMARQGFRLGAQRFFCFSLINVLPNPRRSTLASVLTPTFSHHSHLRCLTNFLTVENGPGRAYIRHKWTSYRSFLALSIPLRIIDKFTYWSGFLAVRRDHQWWCNK